MTRRWMRGGVGPNVVLSYGLGVDSTALLIRWLTDPASRDFDLSDLIVVTSMTGDEWERTGELVERHVLPRLRAAGVRFAQVARRGPLEGDGLAVLSDTARPVRLYLAGMYSLSDEMTAAGTVPQTAGNRLCSQKAKGKVIDTYLTLYAPQATRHAFGYEAEEVARAVQCGQHMPIRLVFGFETDEAERAVRATAYDTPGRVAEFPLIEWGWDRLDCERYIERMTGVADWPKSACVFCPFAMTSKEGFERALRRYEANPESALETLMLERRAVCLNPRSGLIAGKRFADAIRWHLPEIHIAFQARLHRTPHSLYEVRRLWKPQNDNPEKLGNVWRDLRVVTTGTRAECESLVRDHECVDLTDGIARAYVLRRGEGLPAREQLVVAAPAGALDKARPSFPKEWRVAATHETRHAAADQDFALAA